MTPTSTTLTTSTPANTPEHQQRMESAWRLVDPTCPAIRRSWKARINTYGTRAAIEKVCAHLGVTLDDVLESIRHFTATEPTLTEEPGDVIRIQADGYAAGPAGDH